MAKTLLVRRLSISCAIFVAMLLGYHAHIIVNPEKVAEPISITQDASEAVQMSDQLAFATQDESADELHNPFAVSVDSSSIDSSDLSLNNTTSDSMQPEQQSIGFVVATTDQEVLSALRELAELSGHSAYVEQYAEKELNIVQLLRQSPELVNKYLELFANTDDETLQDSIRSLLAASGSAGVETYALENMGIADSQSAHKWAQLLASVGVTDKAHRDQLLEMLDYMQEPLLISTAITAFSPQIIPAEEQEDMMQRLAFYASSDDERVRGASLETLSSWPGEDHSYLLEMGLIDDSEYVRRKAVHAAAYSGTQSEVIKSRLMEILNNDGEDRALRQNAHEALQNYSLNAQEKEELYQFFLEFIKPHDLTGNAVG